MKARPKPCTDLAVLRTMFRYDPDMGMLMRLTRRYAAQQVSVGNKLDPCGPSVSVDGVMYPTALIVTYLRTGEWPE